jgi:hypothetical protein
LRAATIPTTVVDRHTIEGIQRTAADGTVGETNVIPYDLERLFGGHTCVWGGDFNLNPRMDDELGGAVVHRGQSMELRDP